MDNNNDIYPLKTDIAILKANLENIERHFRSIETKFNKLEELSYRLVETTNRIKKMEEKFSDAKTDTVDRRKEADHSYRELKKQVELLSTEAKAYFENRLHIIMNELKELKIEQDKSLSGAYKEIEKMEILTEKIDSRVNTLENWKYYVLGITATLIFFWPAIKTILISFFGG